MLARCKIALALLILAAGFGDEVGVFGNDDRYDVGVVVIQITTSCIDIWNQR